MAGDKTVLADHDREHDVFMFRDAVSLDHVVVSFLVIFCEDLDPAGIPGAHGVGVVTIDVDRAGERTVYEGEADRKPVGSCHI